METNQQGNQYQPPFLLVAYSLLPVAVSVAAAALAVKQPSQDAAA
jgi:hypothetical protein